MAIIRLIEKLFVLIILSPLFLVMGIPAMALCALVAWIFGWIHSDWWIPVAVIIGWISGGIMYLNNN